ncbi:hypothetical protein ACIPT4_07775 [Pectobacterium jejuense]|uniref:hypothetical protein n=1 Tax=Pectobacterium jejuense TaxID=2974022 RepID=UPI0037FFC0A2
MVTPKTQRSNDIRTVNRVVQNLTPALCFDGELTPFIKERTLRQLLDVKDPALSCAAWFFYYFTINDLDKGIQLAEKAVSLMPDDIVTWRHYILCSFWRGGSDKALEITKRAFPATKSPALAYEGCFYSSSSADYSYFLEMHNFITKTGKYDELLREDEEGNMLKGKNNADISERYSKHSEIRSISMLMASKLDLQQKLNSANRLLDLSDDDTPSLLYELHICDASADKCAEMNIELISDRVKAGVTDWSVGAIFVASDSEPMTYVSFTE